MPRDDYHTLERTALWIQAQDSLKVHHPHFSPAPPSPARSSTKSSSTHHSTTSSDATSLRPSSRNNTSMQLSSVSSHLPPPSARASSTHAHSRAPSTSTQRPLHVSHTRRSSLPFPTSPPGSGYPVAMEVAAPRHPIAAGEERKVLLPPVRKDRRPSLLEQIKQLGTPGHRRRDSEPGKKA